MVILAFLWRLNHTLGYFIAMADPRFVELVFGFRTMAAKLSLVRTRG